MSLSDTFALFNDILQAVIVIFGSAVVLYYLGRGLRSPITVAFCALIAFVVIVYLMELLVSRAILAAESWLRWEWVGIAMVPAAQFHLADALLSLTGATPQRRRFVTAVNYLVSLLFLGLVLWTDLIAAQMVRLAHTAHLRAGPLFPLFAFYFWSVTIASIYLVWRARHRCLTSTARRRMTSTLLAFLAAPLGVFPYLVISGNAAREITWWFWLLLVAGNLVVGMMFAILTSNLIYFDAASPDRVVRVRLYKYMARVPLAGTVVLLVYVLVSRGSPIIGLPTETALGFALVTTVMLVEWAIHTYKQTLERFLQLNDDPDVYRIQQLSERVLTTNDLHQFLESLLAALCEALRTPTAFVAAFTANGPVLEASVGPLNASESFWQEADWPDLTQANGGQDPNAPLEMWGGFIVWQNFWIRPLYSRQQDVMVGILGLWGRAELPDFNYDEQAVLEKLLRQAAQALEDRFLQQEVFRAVEGLLPGITALQERRRAATFGGLPVLTAEQPERPAPILGDPEEFNSLVRDALTHYWGGPKLTESPLMRLQIVQRALQEHGTPANALRAILAKAIEQQKPEGERNLTRAEWLLYNILELKFIQGARVRDVARRLAMSESDLYRKQRVAIENVARTIADMEMAIQQEAEVTS